MAQSDATNSTDGPQTYGAASADNYVVVARRYRPQGFTELIGQEHVAQALSNAIATHRVGHAYLFTGARGVGKTSTARILAKALNCVNGPTATPCNVCDSCESITRGDDVDVLEMDGASNRGIDDIRQLRQNVNVRPSRSRFKIYIIDEVHQVTKDAFNALLKTLEEPPEHVKFIFCTTEASKIPITILSRCQRFDFAGISYKAIFQRLQQIAATEGVEAEPEALEVIARRAAGSMRDSQSLLEQLLSFASHKITVEDVHGMLGTAGDERLTELVGHLMNRSAVGALGEIDAAMQSGVDVSQLIEQLFGYFRDCMVAAVGSPPESFLYAAARSAVAVAEAGRRLGLNTILAAMQILEHTLGQLKYSTQPRILAELAVVRICQLEDLEALAGLIVQLRSGEPVAKQLPAPKVAMEPPRTSPAMSAPAPIVTPPAARVPMTPPPAPPSEFNVPVPASSESAKKKYPPAEKRLASERSPVGSAPQERLSQEPSDDSDDMEGEGTIGSELAMRREFVLNADNAGELWSQALTQMRGFVVDHARKFQEVSAVSGDRICVAFGPEYALQKAACQRPDAQAKFEQVLRELAGRTIRIDFKLSDKSNGTVGKGPHMTTTAAQNSKQVSKQKQMQDASEHPMLRRAGELFGASLVSVEEGKE
jgi:DNA polymerase-3 subunit gamma/tau